MDSVLALPKAQSPDLYLTHPTSGEFEAIYSLGFQEWGDALTLPQYLEESAILTNVPLAKDGGMSIWFLTDRTSPPNHRPILCSCETFRNLTYITDHESHFSEAIIHSVASVFCNPIYRRRGYATRLLAELAKILPNWQAEAGRCIGSVLFSDIGTTFYAKRGWHPFPLNTQIEIDPLHVPDLSQRGVRFIVEEDLHQLCKDDEAMIRGTMTSSSSTKLRMMIAPDLDHMLWHLGKEKFACETIFGEQPRFKGAITGEPNDRIWVIWTHRYYGHPHTNPMDNTLYILRVVIENQNRDLEHRKHQAEQMRAILWAAQDEAAKWDLRTVKLWDPGCLLQDVVKRTGIQHWRVEREEESIASLMWFGEGSGKDDMVEWLGNENEQAYHQLPEHARGNVSDEPSSSQKETEEIDFLLEAAGTMRTTDGLIDEKIVSFRNSLNICFDMCRAADERTSLTMAQCLRPQACVHLGVRRSSVGTFVATKSPIIYPTPYSHMGRVC
ncbi:MAG: hypothetical protein Q9169_003284 [Polycauliona sp. 2 TL-2023]